MKLESYAFKPILIYESKYNPVYGKSLNCDSAAITEVTNFNSSKYKIVLSFKYHIQLVDHFLGFSLTGADGYNYFFERHVAI